MDLKSLREKNKERVEKLTKLRKEQASFQKSLLETLVDGPKTVPEIAEKMNAKTQDVLWHLMALKKYNQIQEDKKSGDYISYSKKN